MLPGAVGPAKRVLYVAWHRETDTEFELERKMTMKTFAIASALSLLAGPLFAEAHMATQGDAAAGEELFNRQCVSCHVVVNDEGETLAGRNARTGPNLYGLAGGAIGGVEDYRYGDALLRVNERGDVWTEETFVAYVQDPTGWLRETLDDDRARGKMAYRVRDEGEAYDMYAYLASLAPAE